MYRFHFETSAVPDSSYRLSFVLFCVGSGMRGGMRGGLRGSSSAGDSTSPRGTGFGTKTGFGGAMGARGASSNRGYHPYRR